MSGGILMILAVIAFVVAHEAGHFFAAKAMGMKVSEFFVGFGPKLWSFKRGETEYGVKAVLLGGYVKIPGMSPSEEVSPSDEGSTYRDKSMSAKLLVLLAGISMNFLIGYLLLWTVFGLFGEEEVEVNPIVAELVVFEDGASPAAAAGLEPGDVFVSVGGVAITDWQEVSDQVAANGPGELLIEVQRGDEIVGMVAILRSRPDDPSAGFLGVQPEVIISQTDPGLFESAGLAGQATVQFTKMSYSFFGDLVRPSTLMNLIGGVTGEEITVDARPVSLVGLAQIGAQSQELGAANIMLLLASINIILGSLNVIPLLPLDGGHAALAVYEKVAKRPANLEKLAPFAAIFILFFIFLGVLTIVLDIVNPLELPG